MPGSSLVAASMVAQSSAGRSRRPVLDIQRRARALGNPVLATEGRVTMIDGILATAVLLGLLVTGRTGT